MFVGVKILLESTTVGGEGILCKDCSKVTEEGVSDAMSGTHGSMFLTYNSYEDFLNKNVLSKDTSGIGYH